MPLRSEHSARIHAPRLFKLIRSKTITRGIRLIVGKRCAKCPMETQAVRFDADRFTAAKARAWLRKHGYKPLRFEAAKG